jgi:hypothetical protein
LIKQDIDELDYSGINVTLSKSRDASVEYLNPATDESFTLNYNSFSGDSVTTRQKPDNILSLEKENSNVHYKFIFDAKYRVNPAYQDSSYANRYKGIPGPEEATINTMHRYRDAISAEVDPDKYARTTVGAYVLFPYSDETRFREHKFYQSIEKVDVGAFPFLPGSTELVAEFLDNIIGESAVSNYDRSLLPHGTEEFRSQPDFHQNVIVGSLGKKAQLDFVLENNIYYTPFKESVMGKHLKYVAVFQGESQFGSESGVRYFGEIDEIKEVKRGEIAFPTSREPDRKYILFQLKEWRQLSEVIKIEGYGVSGSHIYTNDILLERAATLPELSIRSFKEWRVWLKLKRLKREVKVKVDNVKLEELESIDGFKDGKISVEPKHDSLYCSNGDNEWKEGYDQLLRNPRGVLNKLIS